MMPARTSLVACLALLASFVCQWQPARAADKVKLSLAATNDPVYLPFFVAFDRGYYRDLGLDVTPLYIGGGTATLGLISGSLQFSSSTGSAVTAILKGAPLKIVMNLTERVPWKLWATRPDIRTLQDLKGKAVGIQNHGDLFEMSMRMALRQAGMSGDAVIYTQLGYGSGIRLQVLRSGSLPAVLLTTLEEKYARAHGLLGRSHVLVDLSRTIRTPNNGLATAERLLATNPAMVERMARGTLMAVRYIKAYPDSALQIMARHAPKISPAILRQALHEFAATILDNGMASPVAEASEIAVREAMIGRSASEAPSPGAVVDYSLVKEAAERLRASKWTPIK
jgi:ABC-type nitrate/sulfonate/bicarbonate transport system substrate-binding protein